MNLTPYHERIINGLQEEGIRLIFDETINLWSLIEPNGVLKEMVMTEYVDELVTGGMLKAVKPKGLPKSVNATQEQVLTGKAPKMVAKEARKPKSKDSDEAIGALKAAFPGEKIPEGAVAIKVKPRPPSPDLNSFMGDLGDTVKMLYEGYDHQGNVDEDLQIFVKAIMAACRITEIVGPDAFRQTMKAMEESLPSKGRKARKTQEHEAGSMGDRLSNMLSDLLSQKKKK